MYLCNKWSQYSRLLFVFLLLLLFGCNTLPISLESKIESCLRSLDANFDGKQNVLLIMPMHGCESCIEKGVAFCKEQLHNKNIHFVFSSCLGKKLITSKFSTNELTDRNITVDYEGVFFDNHIAGKAGLILFYEDQKIIEQIWMDIFDKDYLVQKINEF